MRKSIFAEMIIKNINSLEPKFQAILNAVAKDAMNRYLMSFSKADLEEWAENV